MKMEMTKQEMKMMAATKKIIKIMRDEEFSFVEICGILESAKFASWQLGQIDTPDDVDGAGYG